MESSADKAMRIQREYLDANLSYSFLTILASGYQGSVVAHEILCDLKHPSNPDRAIVFAKSVIEKVASWITALIENSNPLLEANWSGPTGTEAKLGFKMLETLQIELEEVVNLAELIIHYEGNELSEAELSWCIAQMGRFAYARRDNLLFMYNFALISQLPELLQAVSQDLPEGELKVKRVIALVSHFNNRKNNPEFIALIKQEARLIPAMAKLALLDILRMLYSYEGQPTFESLGFNQNEQRNWEAVGLNAWQAGLWWAHGFNPTEMISWTNLDFKIPSSAFLWREQGFSPDEAKEWSNRNIFPIVASRWREAEYTPDKALLYINKGLQIPPGSKPIEILDILLNL
jgi:hypothetical protein